MDFTLYKQLNKTLNWLLPKTCLHCNRPNLNENHPYCGRCYPELPFLHHSCSRCGHRLVATQDYCGPCLTNPPAYDVCFCPFEYIDDIRQQVISLKYHDRPELAKPMAKLLEHEILSHELEMPDSLVPVPMHYLRLGQRGYNQSTLIAKQLGKLLNLPIHQDLIRKNKITQRQTSLNYQNRQKNVSGSFTPTKKDLPKSVAIIDDVVTTGATVNEIAKILKKNGVDYVQVWGIAHTF